MEYKLFTLPRGEPTKEDVKEMEFYIKTGCVHNDYLRDVLGDISLPVDAFRTMKTMPQELLDLPEGERAKSMKEFYSENGFYRAEDLNWLLGSPIRVVVFTEKGLIENLMRCSKN